MKTLLRLLPLFALALTLTACGGDPAPTDDAPAQDATGAMQGAPPAAPAVAQPRLEGGVQVIEITVGEQGYQPQRIALQAGVPARLIFTRTVDSACAEEVQVPAFGVGKTSLPLGEARAVEFTPAEAGEFEFVCGMDMMRGTLVVEV